jgi:hypothetical protein
MAKLVSREVEQPWPTRHRCSDGVLRNLRAFTPEEWLDHPDLQRGGPGDEPLHVLNSERIRAARHFGRSSLAIVSAMARRNRRAI